MKYKMLNKSGLKISIYLTVGFCFFNCTPHSDKNIDKVLLDLRENTVFSLDTIEKTRWDYVYIIKPYMELSPLDNINIPSNVRRKISARCLSEGECILVFTHKNTFSNYSIVSRSAADFAHLENTVYDSTQVYYIDENRNVLTDHSSRDCVNRYTKGNVKYFNPGQPVTLENNPVTYIVELVFDEDDDEEDKEIYIYNSSNKLGHTPKWPNGNYAIPETSMIMDYPREPVIDAIKSSVIRFESVYPIDLHPKLQDEKLGIIFKMLPSGQVTEIIFATIPESKLLYVHPMFFYLLELELKQLTFEVPKISQKLPFVTAGYKATFNKIL